MYGAKKKKSEKFREFFHRHGHHKRSHSSESANNRGNPNWMSAYNPRIVAPAATPSPYPVSILKPTTTTDSSIAPSAKFSSDYDRYMTVRRMNMDRIKELNANGSSNTPHMYDLTEDTVSPLEQDILRMANNYQSPYSSSAYASERPPPSAYASPTPYSPYLWDSSPKPFYQRTQSTPALPHVLSPHSELEQFRSSFASTPTPYTTTTSSNLALSSSQSPPPMSKYDSYYDNKPSYDQQHESYGKRKLHTSTEFASSPITFCPPYSSSSSSYSYPNYNLDDFKPILESPHANRPTFSPLPESEGIDKMHIEDNRAPSPVEDDMILITEQPQIFVEGENGNQVSLEDDLQNLLLNLEQHFGRRPSGLPKAPPPSPADGIASPIKMLDEAIYPDFDFTRDQARLRPRSIASSLSPMQRRFFSASSSGASSPHHSSSPSPTHFHSSPVASDSEYYTPPHSPASSNIVSNLSSHSNTPNSVSSILSPSPESSLPVPPAPVYNHQDLDCQGNFPAPPPPLAFNPDDLHSLPYPNIPPPDFDYSAFDFQGNRIDRPAEEEDEENINNNYNNNNNNNQLVTPHQDNDNELALATYNAEFNQDNKDNGDNDNDNEDNEVEHTSSFTTSTTRDEDSTTVSAIMESTTMSPSVIVATVSTAITTTSTTAIPTTPTSPRRDEPTVIRSLCLTTTAIEPETGHVENSKVTKTAISHPHSHADADSDLSEIIRTSREFDEGFLPPARSSSLNNLLSEIRNGKILKKAKSEGAGLNIQSLSPSLSSISSLPSPSSTIASVLATRRAHMNDDDDIEEDEDQEWI